ncbi:MAG: hypothetical protein RL211_169 [Pseudomonadota bacterium]|jgi:2-amino-4-hydroxy-6-hydroxymethyldihydropteridine diphosphokinase
MSLLKREPVTACIGLGGNLGDARAVVLQAIDDIALLPQTTRTHRSSLYGTAPVDSSGPDYINAVVAVSTSLTAPDLLLHLQRLEQIAGRERPYPNAPRTLDMDILLYGAARIESPSLVVPHPRMFERAFVLVPLAEIAPGLVLAEQLRAVQGQGIRVFAA